MQPGARFRCGCGKVLKVKAAKGHDAAVVRCSACGAPREEGAGACGHCGGDFTLHERNLHTVCPQCLTRVSDKASYCHSCGEALTASTIVGEQSKLQCPSCPGKPRLHSRRLGDEDASVQECQLCAGLWIESRVFEELTKGAEAKASVDDSTRRAPRETNPQTKWSYRKCPDCGAMMQRRHYARRSGVIIDVCRKDGIWFDADELQQILAWIRGGGLKEARQRSKEEDRQSDARREIAAASQPSAGYDDDWFTWGGSNRNSASAMIDAVFSSIFFG